MCQMNTNNEALYHRLRNHPAIKKLISDCGASMRQGYFLLMKRIEEIDSLINTGKSYDDIYSSIIFSDEDDYSYAFLLHVEGKFNTSITSSVQLKELAQIKHKRLDTKYRSHTKLSSEPVSCTLDEDIQNCYYQALECKYLTILERILWDEGKYKDLLNTNPQDYGLPESWNNGHEIMNKEKMILMAIFFFIEHAAERIDPIDLKKISLESIAKDIEAPLSVIQKASNYYSQ